METNQSISNANQLLGFCVIWTLWSKFIVLTLYIFCLFLKISYWEHNLYGNRNNQKPCMINENQRCKMVTLLKSLKKYLCANISDSHSIIHLLNQLFYIFLHLWLPLIFISVFSVYSIYLFICLMLSLLLSIYIIDWLYYCLFVDVFVVCYSSCFSIYSFRCSCSGSFICFILLLLVFLLQFISLLITFLLSHYSGICSYLVW